LLKTRACHPIPDDRIGFASVEKRRNRYGW